MIKTLTISLILPLWLSTNTIVVEPEIEYKTAQGGEYEVISHSLEANEVNIPPVLEKVAFCESNRRQFYEDGTVVKNVNDNGTKDFGYFQINSVHLPEARKLGLDVINSKADNIEFGKILYERHGLTPWYGYKDGKCAWSEVDIDKLIEIYENGNS